MFGTKRTARCCLLVTLFGCLHTPHGHTEKLPDLDCVINPHKVFDLGSGVRGILDKIHVERSDYVEAGEIVAELDSGVERAAVAVAEARAEITSELLLGKLNLEFDLRRKERITNLFVNESISIQNKEDAELAAELSAQRLKEASERDKIRKLELWRAEELLDQKVIRSPGSGFVLKTFKSPGEYIEDQPIVRIAQLDTLNVEVIAPMDLFGKIRRGMTAQVYPEVRNGAPRSAEVIRVDPMGDVASGTFGVQLSLPNEDYSTPAGIKCQLKFDADNAPEAAVGASHLAASAARKASSRTGQPAPRAELAAVQAQPARLESRGSAMSDSMLTQ
jgi:RND family efflux transporter MFP subunit